MIYDLSTDPLLQDIGYAGQNPTQFSAMVLIYTRHLDKLDLKKDLTQEPFDPVGDEAGSPHGWRIPECVCFFSPNPWWEIFNAPGNQDRSLSLSPCFPI